MVLRRVRNVSIGALVGFGSLGYGANRYANSSPPKAPLMNAEEFNRIQNHTLLQKYLVSKKDLLEQTELVVFALKSCPYCAKVKTILDIHNVPYRTVEVDLFTSEEILGSPYRQYPQLQFRTKGDTEADNVNATVDNLAFARAPIAWSGTGSGAGGTGNTSHENVIAQFPEAFRLLKRGPMIVDSDIIVKRLASPLGFDSDLSNPSLESIRKRIADDGSRSVFATMNGTMSRSWESYPLLTTPRYQNPFFRAVGTLALWILATRKIAPRLAPRAPEDALESLCRDFAGSLRPNTTFFGGAQPSLVDAEMFAAMRCAVTHSAVRGRVEKAGLKEWLAAMEKQCSMNASATK